MRLSMAVVVATALVALQACGSEQDAASGCTGSGGTVVTAACCASAHAFPGTCAVGACSCSPESSVPTTLCQCPDSLCFDGESCVQPPG